MPRKLILHCLSSSLLVFMTLSLSGCGGGGDDFSKPLEIPTLPPVSSDEKPAVIPNGPPTSSDAKPADNQATPKTDSSTGEGAEVTKSDAGASVSEKQPAPAEPMANSADKPSTDTPAGPIQTSVVNAATSPEGTTTKSDLATPAKPMPAEAPMAPAQSATKPIPLAVSKTDNKAGVTNATSSVSKPNDSKPASIDTNKKTSSEPKVDAPAKVEIVPLTDDERALLAARNRQAVSIDGQFAVTALSTSRLSTHDIRARSLVQQNFGKQSPVTALAVGPAKQWIVAANESGAIRLWTAGQSTTGLDRIAREALKQAEASKPTTQTEYGVVRVLLVHPNGKALLSGTDNGSLQWWEVTTDKDAIELQAGSLWAAHQGVVTALAISADGKWIVSGGQDRKVQLWDAESRSLVKSWADEKAAISSVAVSPDGRIVAASSFSKTAQWWSTETPAADAKAESKSDEKKPLPMPNAAKTAPIPTSFDHPDLVLSIALSADGKQLLTGCKDKLVRVWDLATGKNVSRLDAAKDAVLEVRFIGAEQRLLTRDRSGLIRNRPKVVAASQDDDDDSPRAVQAANGEWLFATPSEFLSGVSTDANVAVAATYRNERLEGLLAQLRSAESREHRDDARSRYFAPSDSATEPGKKSDTEDTEAPKLPRWKAPTNSIERSEKPQLIGSIPTAFQFGAKNEDGERTSGRNVQLTFTSDSEFLTVVDQPPVSNDQRDRRSDAKSVAQVWIWDVASQGLLRHWDDLPHAASNWQWREGRQQFVGAATGQRLSLVEGTTDELKRLVEIEKLQRVAISPDGKRIAALFAGTKQATNKVVRLFDSATLQELGAYEAFESLGTAVEFTPDGSSVLVCVRERALHRLLMLDGQTLAVQTQLEEQPHPQAWLSASDRDSDERPLADRGITQIVISNDGRSALTHGSYGSGDYRLTLWQRRGNKWVRENHGSTKGSQPLIDELRSPAPMWFISGKSYQIAAISSKGLGIVEATNGRLARSIELRDGGKGRGPYCWSADGNWLVQGDNVGNIALWSLKIDKEPAYFPAHLGPVKALALSPDGQTLASLGEENQLHLWNLSGWVPKNRVIAKRQATKPAANAD